MFNVLWTWKVFGILLLLSTVFAIINAPKKAPLVSVRCGYLHWVRNSPWAQTSCKLWHSRVWCSIQYSFKSFSNLVEESVVKKTALLHPHKFCFCNYVWYQQNVKLSYNTAFMEKDNVFWGVLPSPKQPLNYLRYF